NGREVADAGMKAASTDQAVPQPLNLEGVKVKKLAEEHALLELENPAVELKLGDKIDLIPGHVCTTVNLHDRYYGVRNGKVEVIWPITGRGKFR
ncbi:MAG: DSD1 family PLP-dependent enzyme, partial [Chloroflexi bacterium]|nr:DSD1 family PLP-dependent enzyme [Chloroflexota bacterium]